MGAIAIRPVEALLFLFNLAAFLALFLLPRGLLPWVRHSALIGVFVAAGQLLMEGARWPMIPAYGLSGLFFLFGLAQRSDPAASPPAPWLSLLFGFALLISAALPLLLPVFHFSAPSGPYPIGTVAYHWIDEGRSELFSEDPKDRRELVVQIWYPAKAGAALRRAPYIDDVTSLTSAFARLHGYPRALFNSLKHVRSNAYVSAPAAEAEARYPVLLFAEGATGFRQMNTFQIEELASHGYIVVALDQPYSAAVVKFPDGRGVSGVSVELLRSLVGPSYLAGKSAPTLNGRELEGGSIIAYLAQDLLFVLEKLRGIDEADPYGILTGRLDLERVAAFGVSLGGIVVGEACRTEPRLLACLVMDAPMTVKVVESGLTQPAMWITRDAETMRLERERAGGWSEEEIHAHQSTMRAVFERLTAEGYFVEIPGAFHSNFTDIPLWTPLVRLLGAAGPLDVRRAHAIINGYTLAFFDRHLKGAPAERIEALAKAYPEATLARRRP